MGNLLEWAVKFLIKDGCFPSWSEGRTKVLFSLTTLPFKLKIYHISNEKYVIIQVGVV